MKKLHVAFLWHMHQPLYKDLVTGKYHLPWIRLHSTYSYLDMISILDKFQEARVTFNLTPSLLWQLIDISKDGQVQDTYLELSEKEARHLTPDEKAFILKNFFSCDHARAIAPFEKYKKLFSERGSNFTEEVLLSKVQDFQDHDLRDLQVLFNLAWCGFTLKNENKLVKSLIKKGSNFTEDEKRELLKLQKQVVGSIIPKYKKMQDEGRIELSTSPFYHPILPLLCENPLKGISDFSGDAKLQVKKAINFYEEVFGRKPQGMWPSEGSVSQKIISILAGEDIKWMATDEGILLESFRGEGIPREDLIYKAFSAESDGSHIDMVFRDINLSNAVSFRYSHMSSRRAASDLIHDIKGIRNYVCSKEGEHIASVILDGENPWPYYPGGGGQFLESVYGYFSKSKKEKLVTIGEYLQENKERTKIKNLYAGSWIDRNFNKWIGSPQKNKAWEYLNNAKREIEAQGIKDENVLEELYIAEGSDWFWWYDDFGTELNFVFDDLYRMHLENIYTLMGRKPPHYLQEPIQGDKIIQRLGDFSEKKELAPVNKVVIIASEAVPFAKTGGLADVVGSLAKTLVSYGTDVKVIMPLYKCIKEAGFNLTKELEHVKHPVTGRDSGFNVYSCKLQGVTTYFVDKKKYFNRDGFYSTAKGDYSDNGKRFSFLSKAALVTLQKLDFKPDIIHCNDWQTALVPFFLKYRLSYDSFFQGIKTLFTIHNMAYQGVFSRRTMRRIGIPKRFFNMHDLEFFGKINFMKSGILYSDAVSTVSSRYAEEIMTPKFGEGLDELIRTRKDVLFGIPNGVDYSIWSPKNDKYIKENYDTSHLEKKLDCKRDLLDCTKLSVSIEKPLIGIVSRLAYQKGLDLVAGAMDKLIELGAGVVILGKGDEYYDNLFRSLAKKYPGKVYVSIDFNEELAHKIEAGCDMFLMPSRYEPCGLNQMYSVKYGTIPIARATGGLDDVIIDFDEDRENGNGFKFKPQTGEALVGAVERAIEVYHDKSLREKLIRQAMKYDFSWEKSCEKYLTLYRKIIG